MELATCNHIGSCLGCRRCDNQIMRTWFIIATAGCALCAIVAGGCAPDNPTRSGQQSRQGAARTAGTAVGTPQNPGLVQVRVSQFQMGMMVHLTVWAPSVEQGQQACATAFRRIREINLKLSDYEPTSELSQFCRKAGQGPQPISEELLTVLAAAQRLARLSEGRYDPTAGPLSRLWREVRQTGQPPDRQAVREAIALVDYRKLVLDSDTRTADLKRPGMLLDLGGIAKGYAGDEALLVLQQHGIHHAAFEAGGDKVLGRAPPGTKGWKIESPQADKPPLLLENCAVSISGDTEQYLEIDGHRYSHVIDPRTGWGVDSRQMCIAIAPQGLLSDPLATLGTLMPGEEFKLLVDRHFEGVQVEVFPAPSQKEDQEPRVPPR
jgi:thiamine biosynthesis lipoprotein